MAMRSQIDRESPVKDKREALYDWLEARTHIPPSEEAAPAFSLPTPGPAGMAELQLCMSAPELDRTHADLATLFQEWSDRDRREDERFRANATGVMSPPLTPRSPTSGIKSPLAYLRDVCARLSPKTTRFWPGKRPRAYTVSYPQEHTISHLRTPPLLRPVHPRVEPSGASSVYSRPPDAASSAPPAAGVLGITRSDPSIDRSDSELEESRDDPRARSRQHGSIGPQWWHQQGAHIDLGRRVDPDEEARDQLATDSDETGSVWIQRHDPSSDEDENAGSFQREHKRSDGSDAAVFEDNASEQRPFSWQKSQDFSYQAQSSNLLASQLGVNTGHLQSEGYAAHHQRSDAYEPRVNDQEPWAPVGHTPLRRSPRRDIHKQGTLAQEYATRPQRAVNVGMYPNATYHHDTLMQLTEKEWDPAAARGRHQGPSTAHAQRDR